MSNENEVHKTFLNPRNYFSRSQTNRNKHQSGATLGGLVHHIDGAAPTLYRRKTRSSQSSNCCSFLFILQSSPTGISISP